MRLMTCRGDLLIYTEEMGIWDFHLSHIRQISDYLCTSNAFDIPREAIIWLTVSFGSNLCSFISELWLGLQRTQQCDLSPSNSFSTRTHDKEKKISKSLYVSELKRDSSLTLITINVLFFVNTGNHFKFEVNKY